MPGTALYSSRLSPPEKSLYSFRMLSVSYPACGEVTERPMVLAWKAGVVKATGGSNPPLSARIKITDLPLGGIRSGTSADLMSEKRPGRPRQRVQGRQRRNQQDAGDEVAESPSPPYSYIVLGFRLRLPVEVTAGSRATDIRELRQARKGAAVTVLCVCRGGAWLSLVSAIFFFPYP